MSLTSHVRVVSLVLALSVATGGWLLLEFRQGVPQQASLMERQSEATNKNAAPPERASSPPPKGPSPVSAVQPKKLIITFKCEQIGLVSYSDKLYVNDAKTLAVTATEDTQSQHPTTNLHQLKARAAAIEADRLPIER